MATQVHPVQRLRVDEESSFATDQSGSIGSFKEVPAIEGSMQFTHDEEMLDPGQLVQHIDQQNEKIRGVRGGTLSFDVALAPTGVAADSSTTAVQSALGEIFKTIMGGETLAQGDTINDAGAAATDFDVTNVGRWKVGGAIGLINSAGVLEVTEIESISSNNLAFKRSFSFTPSNGATCYNAASYHMAKKPGTTLQFAAEGIVDDDRWLLCGCQLASWTFRFESGTIPIVSLSFTVAGWLHGEDASTPLTGASLGTSTYANYSPIATKDSAFIVGTVTNATRQSGLKASAFSVTPNVQYGTITAPGGSGESDVICEYVRLRQPPTFSAQFTAPFEDETWRAHKEALDDMYCWIEFGQTAGKMVVISLPTVQVIDTPRVDAAGIASQQVSLEARLDSETSGDTSEFAQSVARIHFL